MHILRHHIRGGVGGPDTNDDFDDALRGGGHSGPILGFILPILEQKRNLTFGGVVVVVCKPIFMSNQMTSTSFKLLCNTIWSKSTK